MLQVTVVGSCMLATHAYPKEGSKASTAGAEMVQEQPVLSQLGAGLATCVRLGRIEARKVVRAGPHCTVHALQPFNCAAHGQASVPQACNGHMRLLAAAAAPHFTDVPPPCGGGKGEGRPHAGGATSASASWRTACSMRRCPMPPAKAYTGKASTGVARV